MGDQMDPEPEVRTGIINDDPVKLVLSIELILKKILAELDNKSFYNSRLVSQSWNFAALAIFPKNPIKGQTPRVLRLNYLFKSSESNPTFDAKLAKSIKFIERCTCKEKCRPNSCISTRTKFLEFWTQYSDKIENAKLTIFEPFGSTFCNVMSNFGKNLRSLFFEIWGAAHRPEPVNLVCEQSFQRVNLHTIDLQGCWEFLDIFQAPMQAIISGAPNLRKLKLGEVFYPDLSQNKKLKYLSHFYLKLEESFNHENLSRLFFQVKDSLETLILLSQNDEDLSFDPKHFNFPMMPKLKKLKNNDVSLHPMRKDNNQNQTLFEILNTKFPALKNLKIRDPYGNGVQAFFDQLIQKEQKSQEKIVTLAVERIVNPSILTNFKKWFPNLRKLDLLLSKPTPVGPEVELVSDDFIDSALSKLTGIGLKQFTFRVDFKFLLTDLVNTLIKNAELFKGLTSFEMHTKDDYDSMVDDLSKSETLRTQFCEWLVNMKQNANRLIFHGFSFSGETSWDLIPCIRDKNLPVKFVNEDFEEDSEEDEGN